MRGWLVGLFLVVAAQPALAASKAVVLTETHFFDVATSGAVVETVHIEMMATAEDAVARVAQYHIGYTAGLDTVQVLQAFSQTASGKTYPVTPDMMFDQGAPGPVDAKVFTGRNKKVILFPHVKPWTVVNATFRITKSAIELPGDFDAAVGSPSNMMVMSARVVVHTPAAMILHAEATSMQADDWSDGDRHVWTWSYVKHNRDETPFVRISSFADHDAMAHALGTLMLPHERVTPDLQALADRLTTGLASPTDQARALYDWVSLHVRYVEVGLGTGGIIPQDADTVFQHRYGDCKDHAILLSTLLKVKGLGAQLILVNRGSSFDEPTMAAIGNFNHMIAYIPSLALYADTTDGVVPFGSLSPEEYGKPVLHLLAAGEPGPALAHVPLLPPDKAAASVDTVETLAADGTIAGTTVTTATGPFSMMLRAHGRALQMQATGSASDALRDLGVEGGGKYEPASLTNLRDAYSVTGRFQLAKIATPLADYTLVPPPGLTVFSRLGPEALGEIVSAEDRNPAPRQCLSGTITEGIAMTLPAGLHPQALPAAVALHFPLFDYTADWSSSGDVLSVRRVLTTHVTTATCSGDDRVALSVQYGAVTDELKQGVRLVQ